MQFSSYEPLETETDPDTSDNIVIVKLLIIQDFSVHCCYENFKSYATERFEALTRETMMITMF